MEMSKLNLVGPYGRDALLWALVILLTPVVCINLAKDSDFASARIEDNSIETHRHIGCGTIATNVTNFLVKNPHYPEPTYTKSICETVVERAGPSISKLNIKFERLELYRSTTDGQCLHDRFAVYTDLNAPLTPILCGNQTGKTLTIPFAASQTGLVLSVTTSDLDHDRLWAIEIGQE